MSETKCDGCSGLACSDKCDGKSNVVADQMLMSGQEVVDMMEYLGYQSELLLPGDCYDYEEE